MQSSSAAFCVMSALVKYAYNIELFCFFSITAAFVGIYLLAANNGNGSSLLGDIGKYELLAVFGTVLCGLALVIVKKHHVSLY